MVTAELAVGIASLLIVLTLALSALSLGATHVTLVDAARLAARSAARGDTAARVVETAQSVAPGASVAVSSDGDGMVVSVRGRAPVLLGVLGISDPVATARTPIEASALTEEE
ncbi:MAG: pilus assembly protein TadE [Phycicoccus sp.]|nr:pilus assembly protein TadE [Phycicoccus sp.]